MLISRRVRPHSRRSRCDGAWRDARTIFDQPEDRAVRVGGCDLARTAVGPGAVVGRNSPVDQTTQLEWFGRREITFRHNSSMATTARPFWSWPVTTRLIFKAILPGSGRRRRLCGTVRAVCRNSISWLYTIALSRRNNHLVRHMRVLIALIWSPFWPKADINFFGTPFLNSLENAGTFEPSGRCHGLARRSRPRVSLEELNTSRLLAHARIAGGAAQLDDLLIVDVDRATITENECFDEFLP